MTLLGRFLGSEDAAARWRERQRHRDAAERERWMRQGAARDRAYAEAAAPPMPPAPRPDPRLEQAIRMLRALALDLMLRLPDSQKAGLQSEIKALAREVERNGTKLR